MTADKWAESVEVGDVVKSPGGMLRVVRTVQRHKPERWNNVYARKVHVTFTIQRCSWTHRPCTCYNIGELFCLGYRPTGAKFSVSSKFDKLVLEDIRRGGPSAACTFDCCDVIGIP